MMIMITIIIIITITIIIIVYLMRGSHKLQVYSSDSFQFGFESTVSWQITFVRLKSLLVVISFSVF